MKEYSAIVVTDLDGTLAASDGSISAVNSQTLMALGQRQVLRVIATGRSLKSATDFLGDKFPIDFLIFSSGAGVVSWLEKRLMVAHNLTEATVARVAHRLDALGIGYFLHGPVPDNHHFCFRSSAEGNLDFHRRLSLLREYGQVLGANLPRAASQFLVVDATVDSSDLYTQMRTEFSDLAVIRATSPLDHCSSWLEIFSPLVSKSRASEWLAKHFNLGAGQAVAIGNDYNDQDLLDWASRSYVVANAPAYIRARHFVVASNDSDGFAEAVWKSGVLA